MLTNIRLTLLTAVAALWLTACGGEPEAAAQVADAPTAVKLMHTETSITLDDGRVVEIPDSALAPDPVLGQLTISSDWVRSTYSYEEQKAIRDACIRENKKLQALSNNPMAQVPNPLAFVCNTPLRKAASRQ